MTSLAAPNKGRSPPMCERLDDGHDRLTDGPSEYGSGGRTDTPLVLARGTYEPFHVKTDSHSLIDFEAKAKSHVDIVVRQHTVCP